VNLPRVLLATLGATVIYFGLGALFFTLPSMRAEFSKYPAVYRSQEGMKGVMPLGMIGMLASIGALAVLFAKIHPSGSGVVAGAEFGALIGLFAIGSFVLHNYVNLNVGARLTLYQSAAYFLEWVAVGMVIGLIYRGAGS